MNDMTGKRVLITGATTGIGLESARALTRQGAELIIVGRNPEKTKAVAEELKATYFLADLSLLADVRRLGSEVRAKVDRLDVLLNNAGALNTDRVVTSEGFELTFVTNHLSYFLLTHELLPLLRKAPKARIVSVASEAHRRAQLDFADLQMQHGYSAFGQYSRSKLANILFTRTLAHKLAGSSITANCLHPGVVASNFFNKKGVLGLFGKIGGLFMITPVEGAKTSVYLASSPEVDGISGLYFDKCKPKTPTKAAQDDVVAAKLWKVSAELTGTSESLT